MPMSFRPLRIGTRGSPMALRQTAIVRDRLAAAHPDLAAAGAVEIVTIRTTGDRVQDRLLAEIGGKGLFAKEIEEALIARNNDLAVHSRKDWRPGSRTARRGSRNAITRITPLFRRADYSGPQHIPPTDRRFAIPCTIPVRLLQSRGLD